MKPEEFLEKICSLNNSTHIWYLLWESGGAQRFTDILRFSGVSRSFLSHALGDLLELELIRQVNGKYQAIRPEGLGREKTQEIYDSLSVLRNWMKENLDAE